MKNIGVLAFQGAFIEHIEHIKALGHNHILVKTIEDLEKIDGIILPGGESTTMGKLLKDTGLLIPLREKILNGLPAWGTCAGMILLAKEIENQKDSYLNVMNIRVKRNAYGSQIESFSSEEFIDEFSSAKIPLVFIRAPYITSYGKTVKPIFFLNNNLVAARENNILVTSFHPELTSNLEVLKYFVNMITSK